MRFDFVPFFNPGENIPWNPGSIFGNFVFGKPNNGYEDWMLGMPSIWAWQIIWWALGVGVVWFLANKLRMSTEPEIEIKSISSE